MFCRYFISKCVYWLTAAATIYAGRKICQSAMLESCLGPRERYGTTLWLLKVASRARATASIIAFSIISESFQESDILYARARDSGHNHARKSHTRDLIEPWERKRERYETAINYLSYSWPFNSAVQDSYYDIYSFVLARNESPQQWHFLMNFT